MKTTAILYSTVDGQTKNICKVLAAELEHKNFRVFLYPIDKFEDEICTFDLIIIGASIRYGKHNDFVSRFINQNQRELERIKTAFFSVNLVARKAGKDRPETNPYLKKFIDSINWKPDLTNVFAGRLDYKKYGFFDRLMIKIIMKITDGPTTSKEPIEYTDWQRVKEFAQELGQLKTNMKSKFAHPMMH